MTNNFLRRFASVAVLILLAMIPAAAQTGAKVKLSTIGIRVVPDPNAPPSGTGQKIKVDVDSVSLVTDQAFGILIEGVNPATISQTDFFAMLARFRFPITIEMIIGGHPESMVIADFSSFPKQDMPCTTQQPSCYFVKWQ